MGKINWFGLYWAIIILVLPVFHIPVFMDSRVYKDILFLIAGIGSLALFSNNIRSLWSLFSIIFVLYSAIGFNAYINGNAFFQTINLLMGLALVSQFATHWDDEVSKWISNALSLACIIQAIWIICQYYDWEPTIHIFGIDMVAHSHKKGQNGGWPMEGSLDNKMVTASYMAPLIPFLLRKYWVAFLPLALLGLWLLDSAMGYLGFCAVSVYFTWHTFDYNKKLLVGSSIFTVIGTIVGIYRFPEFFQSSGRYQAWIEIFKWIKVTWIGYGQGFFHQFGWQVIKSISGLRHAHNEYVQAYVTYGIVGIILIGLMLMFLFRHHKKEPVYAASLLGILATSFGAFPLYISSSALIFIIALGALLNHSIRPRRSYE